MPANARKWTRVETEILIREYPRRPTSDVALFVGHPLSSTSNKARAMGLKKARRSHVWQPWMTDILKKHYGDTGNDKIAAWLGVSRSCVISHAKSLGLAKEGRLRRPCGRPGAEARITPEQGELIRQAVGSRSMGSIAAEIGFTPSAVSRYCRRTGISRFWVPSPDGGEGTVTKAGMAYIRNQYAPGLEDEISARTGIPSDTVALLGATARKERARRRRKPLRWTSVTEGDPGGPARVVAACAVEAGPEAGATEYLMLDYDPDREYTDDLGRPVRTVTHWIALEDLILHAGGPGR